METTFNQVLLLGSLGEAPKLITTKKGSTFSHLLLNVTDAYNQEHGQTQWAKVSIAGDLASRCCKELKGGDVVLVNARIQTKSFKNQKGEEKSFMEVFAWKVVNLSKPEEKPLPAA